MKRNDPLLIENAGEVLNSPAKRSAWVKLLIGMLAIVLFICGLTFLSKQVPALKHMSTVIDERHLNAAAIFYTGVEESGEGSALIRNSLEYAPISSQTDKPHIPQE